MQTEQSQMNEITRLSMKSQYLKEYNLLISKTLTIDLSGRNDEIHANG